MEKVNAFDILKERGFIKQVTHEEPIRELLGKESDNWPFPYSYGYGSHAKGRS